MQTPHSRHSPKPKPATHVSKQRRMLLLSFVIISAFMLAEALGGWLTHSLALLSDAGHMLSDAAALGATLLAFRIGDKAADTQKTFGYKRFEILVAGANGATLIIIAVMIVVEALGRFLSPPDIATQGMLIIAVMGLTVNVVVALLLHRSGSGHQHIGHHHDESHRIEPDHAQHNHRHLPTAGDGHLLAHHDEGMAAETNLNMHSAYLHVLGDLLGSVAAIIAALAMMWFGWWWADPLASILVAMLILISGYRVVKASTHILMEGTPDGLKLEQIVALIKAEDGVVDVHDLHVWTITSGLHALSCHVVVKDNLSIHAASEVTAALAKRLQQAGISHSTIQIEDLAHFQAHDDDACVH